MYEALEHWKQYKQEQNKLKQAKQLFEECGFQYKEKAKRQGYQNRTNFSFDKMKEKIDEILSKKVPNIPKQVSLTLPKLKKIGEENKQKLPKLKLPKLKKVEV